MALFFINIVQSDKIKNTKMAKEEKLVQVIID